MAISLYTSRLILNTLGIEDYGIYSVVGGFVLMFSTLNSSMTTSVQRFMNFEMGINKPGKDERLNNIFNTSIIIHLGIAVIIFLLLESIGSWYLNNHMNIPTGRVGAAKWVFQFSIFTLMVNIINVPYNALIIAHERMSAFALISILEVVLKLVIVYLVILSSWDKLKLYAVLMFLISVIMRIIYSSYAIKNFKESKFKWNWNSSLFKEMSGFAGWNLIGVSSTMLRTQGSNVLLNYFFGVVINAATGIAFQVKNTLDSFVLNFMIALNPQITKSYAANDYKYLMQLIFKGSKYSYYLLLFVAIPIFIETEIILELWLKIVPPYAVIFVRLLLIISLLETLSKTLIQSMFATGRIRKYQIIVGSITILNLPLSIIMLYLGFPPQSVFIIVIIIAIISLFVRLIMLKPMINIEINKFITNVILNVLIVSIIALILPIMIIVFQEPGSLRLLFTTLVSILSVGGTVYFVGLQNNERVFVKNAVIKTIKRLTKK